MSQPTSIKPRARVIAGQLEIDKDLYEFVNHSVLNRIGMTADYFWSEFESLVVELQPENQALLAIRDKLQNQIDDFHRNQPNADFATYKAFLKEIGYLRPSPANFKIAPKQVDDEIAKLAGPQLVVPVMNARYALNAANARWGSLYDALYGTDVISEDGGAEKGGQYNPLRGQKVIEYGRSVLNQYVPLKDADYNDITGFSIDQGSLRIATENGSTELQHPVQFIGFQGEPSAPSAVVFQHNGLHLIVQMDSQHVIGMTDKASIKDILMESALTTIMDCEDSVAAVDAEDKIVVYKNWLGLMQGDLAETVTKGDKAFTRELNKDIEFTNSQGLSAKLHGRALLFVRNVGHLMTNPAVLVNGREIPEGIMDAVFTSAIAKIDLQKDASSAIRNSRTGSVYIVKPKMHGPDEVAFANTLFNRVEDLLELPRHTLKMGIMDEERRTSVNLAACVEQAKDRVVFINTGFLDRTGDEIHTSMEAGVFAPKAELKAMPWIQAYENSNVATGLQAGFPGKAQIGKGMWPIPDQMAEMMKVKVGHPKAGANTAWVPSPTAATLHALHYHQVSVADVQSQLAEQIKVDVDTILQIPLLKDPTTLTDQVINKELENNAQGILGYVVRWIDQGVGCSKVPDINDVGLMEDRATCRISSQHMSNWLHHGICTEQQVIAVMQKMAAVVDKQNQNDPLYQPMADNFDSSIAFQAALDLVLKGTAQPSGYTEPLLHKYRLLKKQ